MPLFISPVEFSDTQLLDRLTRALEVIFKTKVYKVTIPLNVRNLFSSERGQYYSTGFIEQAIDKTMHLNGKIILITGLDLYVPVLTFVFGEAQLNGKHSIVSVFRLHEEFYLGITDNELLYERTLKEVLHELGHNFGLIHCELWDCVMHSSNSIEEVDIKGADYCKSCRNRLKSFDIMGD